jgi:predicted dehydrogenase
MNAVKSIVVGTGDYARWHIRGMLCMPASTILTGLVNRPGRSRDATRALFDELRRPCPPWFDTIRDLIDAQGPPDAALICTAHKFHFDNARDCLQRGVDVLIEKPMVMNATEARRLIRLQEKTGRLVVVAFPGSLSPAIHAAKKLIQEGAIGQVTAVSAFAHQNWRQKTAGTWRHDPDLSGGGFLFDTGSHMINTVLDLIGEDVARVTALLDNRGDTVDINASVSGVFRNGVMFSLSGAGESVHCASQIMVFGDRGVLQTGIWGERVLIKRADQSEFAPVSYASSQGAWEQFLRVRAGEIANPCPPAIGLRFAQLMDMIRKSAATGQAVAAR